MANCAVTEPVLACYTLNGVSETVLMHIVYENGKPIGRAFTSTDAETAIDTSAGIVTLGACPVAMALASPDVEYTKLCDRQADGSIVEFYSRTLTTFDATNTPTTQVDNFALDKTTPYVIAGTVQACDEGCDLQGSVGLITNWNQLN